MKRAIRLVIPGLIMCLSLQQAHGQANDFWIGEFEKNGLYQPHAATGARGCSVNEAFVAMGSEDLGFCIEKDERVAETWEYARQTCAAAGKRLPEPAEFKIACKQAGALGLNDMTDDYEWASNETTYTNGMWWGGSMQSLLVPVLGEGGCQYGSMGPVTGLSGGSVAIEISRTFRCVH